MHINILYDIKTYKMQNTLINNKKKKYNKGRTINI